MKKVVVCLCLVFMFCSVAFAGVLPGGMKGTASVAYEDDQLDPDGTLIKTKFKFKKDVLLGDLPLTPYVWIEDESYHSPLSIVNRKELDSAIGLDIQAFKDENYKLTLTFEYEYQDNIGTDNDGLLTFKTAVDF